MVAASVVPLAMELVREAAVVVEAVVDLGEVATVARCPGRPEMAGQVLAAGVEPETTRLMGEQLADPVDQAISGLLSHRSNSDVSSNCRAFISADFLLPSLKQKFAYTFSCGGRDHRFMLSAALAPMQWLCRRLSFSSSASIGSGRRQASLSKMHRWQIWVNSTRTG